jgi:hypothetical protein
VISVKFWVRFLLAVSGLAILAIVGGYFISQYVPGLSSSLAQSLSIAILSIGIASSSIAVLSGRSLEEHYRRKNEEKRVKSAFVSYLSRVYYEIVSMGVTFNTVSKIYSMPPPDLRNPALSASYQEFGLDPYMQTEARNLIEAKPIDASYYRDNVQDHLLFMSPELANQASTVDAMIYVLNDYYSGLSDRINKELPFPKTDLLQLPPRGYVIHANLHTHRKAYEKLNQFALRLRDHVFALKNAILYDKKDLPDPLPLFAYDESIRAALEEGDKNFLMMLFPSQTSSKP